MHNSVLLEIAGDLLNQESVFLRNFLPNGQGSTFNPLPKNTRTIGSNNFNQNTGGPVMKKLKKFKLPVVAIIIIILFPLLVSAQKDDSSIIPVYSGSDIRYDDQIGFEEFSFIINETTVQNTEGVLRRIFCRAPEGRSPLEIIKNYENAIKEDGGSILFISRNPKEIVINGEKFSDIFKKNRKDRGLSTSVFTHTEFPKIVTEYLAGKLSITDKDVYIIIAAGPGAWAASEDKRTFYELITLEVEPMEMGMITSADIGKGLSTLGRIAIYGIYFDTGKSEVKPESADALKAIAEYLNASKTQKVLIVGHTDNTGDFDMNISLSKDRANAVMKKLISEYAVSGDQLKPYGVGPVSPVASNSTEQGRAQNRRVEIVEQ